MMRDGTKLAGWYLTPRGPAGDRPGPPWPALLWFYGNGENIASIGAIVRDFQPPGAALLVVDYPGYGGSGGRAAQATKNQAGHLAYAPRAPPPDLGPAPIYSLPRSPRSPLALPLAPGGRRVWGVL